MAKRKRRDDDVQRDTFGPDAEQATIDEEEAASDSAGQSGDAQGLSSVAEADGESVEELAETDQEYEAEVVEGVEDAGDHPEQPVRTREDKRR